MPQTLAPETGRDTSEHRPHDPDAESIEDMLDNFQVNDSSWYEMPGGNKIQGKDAAADFLRSHLARSAGDDIDPDTVIFACIKHPSLVFYGPAGTEKVETADGKVKEVKTSKRLGQFEDGVFKTSDPEVISVLDNTPYVVRDN